MRYLEAGKARGKIAITICAAVATVENEVMSEFPAEVEERYGRLAAQRRWPPETEAAFRSSRRLV